MNAYENAQLNPRPEREAHFAEFKQIFEKDAANKIDVMKLTKALEILDEYGLDRAYHDTLIKLCECLDHDYTEIKRAGIEKYKDAPRDRYGFLS